jgi:hypothetical protein
MKGPELGDEVLLRSRMRVPEHVVYRDFGDETVALNLDSGMYHGLNGTAATMVTVAGQCDSVGAAVERLAAEFEQPAEVIQRDLLELCRALSERGLIELESGEPG